MKKSWLLLLATAAMMGWTSLSEAAVIPIRQPGIVITQGQPLQAIIVDSYGTTYQQIVYYNPFIGGIELDLSWAGPNASIYFPELGIGYIWYNGYWVDEEGYYWDQNNRVYIGYPQWNYYWVDYWSGHWDDRRYGRWHDKWGRREHRKWHRKDWKDKEDRRYYHRGIDKDRRRIEWQGKDKENWRRKDVWHSDDKEGKRFWRDQGFKQQKDGGDRRRDFKPEKSFDGGRGAKSEDRSSDKGSRQGNRKNK